MQKLLNGSALNSAQGGSRAKLDPINLWDSGSRNIVKGLFNTGALFNVLAHNFRNVQSLSV